ncbi:hypothetical protein [Kitasatospora sp. NPDC005751]|uniref:hypothetical protein n=1 Tax=Kitasatospora sp. NPDC005751 TaxID=3157064 RepID=UPI0033FA13E0
MVGAELTVAEVLDAAIGAGLLALVDAVVFTVERLHLALSLMTYGQAETWVWLHRTHQDPDHALTVLLRTLGLGRDALVFTGGPDTGFHYQHGHRPS